MFACYEYNIQRFKIQPTTCTRGAKGPRKKAYRDGVGDDIQFEKLSECYVGTQLYTSDRRVRVRITENSDMFGCYT